MFNEPLKEMQPSNNPRRFTRPSGPVIVLDDQSQVFQLISQPQQNSSSILELASTSTPETSPPPPDTTSFSSPCLLPSSNFSGDYNFDIHFESTKSETKKVGWTYSEERDKLYVAKDHPCPINFITGRPTPPNAKIRLTPVFALPEHANDVVRRCINHSFMDLNSGIFNPDHIIRCECDQAAYETDEVTERRSVVLPYEHPSGANEFSTYIFKFVCFGSCTGGLNRRPIRVIFTLEVNKIVVGRRTLDVKICACPWRDCKNENKQSSNSSLDDVIIQKESRKRKKDLRDVSFPELSEFINKFKSKRIKNHSNGPYNITVYDEKLYEFLLQIKKLYELHEKLEALHPSTIKALQTIQKKHVEKKFGEESLDLE